LHDSDPTVPDAWAEIMKRLLCNCFSAAFYSSSPSPILSAYHETSNFNLRMRRVSSSYHAIVPLLFLLASLFKCTNRETAAFLASVLLAAGFLLLILSRFAWLLLLRPADAFVFAFGDDFVREDVVNSTDNLWLISVGLASAICFSF
jgi:hypothetical protein